MEMFPAADEDQWSLIRSVIDDCDYYILVIAGRYGSIGPGGISYTEMEYDYAVSTNKPVIAFLHADPRQIKVEFSETDTESLKKLDRFRAKAKLRSYRPWTNAEELGGVASRSLIQQIKARPADGWVRAKEASRADELATRLDKLTETFKDVTGNLYPNLYNLDYCRDDFEKTLKYISKHKEIVVNHFGLDMTQAWGYIYYILFGKYLNFANIDYRLLILTDERKKGRSWPSEVADWSSSVPRSLLAIERDMGVTSQQMTDEGRQLRFEVRKYSSIPFTHGWCIRQPIRVWYLAFCRWDGEKYDWGGDNYIKISDQSNNSISKDLASVFDSYFEHNWTTSPVVPRLKHLINWVESTPQSAP